MPSSKSARPCRTLPSLQASDVRAILEAGRGVPTPVRAGQRGSGPTFRELGQLVQVGPIYACGPRTRSGRITLMISGTTHRPAHEVGTSDHYRRYGGHA